MSPSLDMRCLRQICKDIIGPSYAYHLSSEDLGKLRIRMAGRNIGAVTLDHEGEVQLIEGTHFGPLERHLFRRLQECLNKQSIRVHYAPSYVSDDKLH